jgi:hypothetical protein
MGLDVVELLWTAAVCSEGTGGLLVVWFALEEREEGDRQPAIKAASAISTVKSKRRQSACAMTHPCDGTKNKLSSLAG